MANNPPSRHFGEEIRIEDFEREITLRQLTIEDFDALIEMQDASFPGMQTWKRDQIESQIAIFPEGQLAIEYEGRLVASASSLIVDFEDYLEWHDWKEIADNGYIRNHDPEGDTLYGTEIMVHPEFRGLKLARRLYAGRRDIARRFNLARSIVGGRIPGYRDWADELNAREYAERVVEGQIYDPVLTTQTANGFVLKQLIPDYFPSDEASRGYATFLEWTNLDYLADPRRRYQRVHNVRLAAVQYLMRSVASVEEFEAQCEFFIDAVSDYKSDFVVFPELFTTQKLSFLKPRERPQQAARDLAGLTPRYLEFYTRTAMKFNVNIVAGSQFVLEGEKFYNVSYFFHRDGGIDQQYKLHITPAERRWWGVSAGDELEVFETDRGKVAILICYDVEFPELARAAAAKGAQILFVPFNTNDRDGYLRIRTCAQARCIENHVYTVISGCTGNLPFVENADLHYAQSGIFTPQDVSFARDGVAAECTPNIETLVVRDVDVEHLRRHACAGPSRTGTTGAPTSTASRSSVPTGSAPRSEASRQALSVRLRPTGASGRSGPAAPRGRRCPRPRAGEVEPRPVSSGRSTMRRATREEGEQRPRSRWRNVFIAAPLYGTVFFIASPLLAVGLVALLAAWPAAHTRHAFLGLEQYPVPLFITVWTHAHLVAVFFRSHGDLRIFAWHRVAFTVVLLALFGFFMLFDTAIIAGLVVSEFWATYHIGG